MVEAPQILSASIETAKNFPQEIQALSEMGERFVSPIQSALQGLAGNVLKESGIVRTLMIPATANTGNHWEIYICGSCFIIGAMAVGAFVWYVMKRADKYE